MATNTAGGTCTAYATWDPAHGRVYVALQFSRISNWKQPPSCNVVLCVEGYPSLSVSVQTYISYGTAEDWGEGDVDYSDVFLTVSLQLLQRDQAPVRTFLTTVLDSPLAKKPWRLDPSGASPVEQQRTSCSVGGLFGELSFFFTLIPASPLAPPTRALPARMPPQVLGI